MCSLNKKQPRLLRTYLWTYIAFQDPALLFDSGDSTHADRLGSSEKYWENANRIG